MENEIENTANTPLEPNKLEALGFGAKLENTIEGLVRLQDLKDDFYNYDPELHQHIGEHRGKIFTLGQEIRIKVAKADVSSKQIDFEPIE